MGVIIQLKMTRRFLRPFFAFWSEPTEMGQYISKKSIPGGVKGRKEYERGVKRTVDPGETFDNFFQDYYGDTQALKKEEKEFFQKHYPQRVGKKFNPYEVLNVDKNADLEQIKEAYRANAIKYHPKSDTSVEAQRKFQDIARAYNELLHEVSERRTDDMGEDVSTKSLFEDFQHQMEEFNKQPHCEQKAEYVSDKLNMQAQGNTQYAKPVKISKPDAKQQKKSDVKTGDKEKKSDKGSNVLKGAELYSESSYYEFINGQRKLRVTRMYEKDGKTLKVDRVEGQLPDGSIQVNETLDDGKEIKNRTFIQGSKKQKSIPSQK